MRRALSAIATAVVMTVPAVQLRAAPSLAAASPRSGAAIRAMQPRAFAAWPTTLGPGSTLTVSGSGCPAGMPVTVLADAREVPHARGIAALPAREDGGFGGMIKVPNDIGLGNHSITAVCAGHPIGSARIRVVVLGLVAFGRAPGMLTVSRSAVRAGRTVRLFAEPCRTGTTSATLNDVQVRLTAPARVGAALMADLTIPSGTAPGTYTLSTRCEGLVVGVATLRVVAAGGSLPARPDDPPVQQTKILLGAAGLLLVVAAGAVVLMTVKRHHVRTATPGYFDLPSSHRSIR